MEVSLRRVNFSFGKVTRENLIRLFNFQLYLFNKLIKIYRLSKNLGELLILEGHMFFSHQINNYIH